MNKKVLIISPYFPPSNAADMQRVRTSLPYFRTFGWDAAVVTVDEKYADVVKDDLLTGSVPGDIKIYKTKALSRSLTARLGLGSLALRSLWYYKRCVNRILEQETYDLVYFSTTQFPVCILGPYWKKRFRIPFVIDFQDPWHSEYYKDKQKAQRPPKYWFSYRLHKYLEPIAVKHADGLISVSEDYLTDLQKRYPVIAGVPVATVIFGAFENDLKIAASHQDKFPPLLRDGFINIVYVGRGGMDMHEAIIPLFSALQDGLRKNPELFRKLRLYFIGTSYAPKGTGIPSVSPLAKEFGLEGQVTEVTDRISYYHTLLTLQQADALFIPGSDDPKYTASKILPYLLTEKPLMAIFNKNSSAVRLIQTCTKDAVVLTFDADTQLLIENVYKTLVNWANGAGKRLTLTKKFDNYSAERLTGDQVALFARAIEHYKGFA